MEKQQALENLKTALEDVVNHNYEHDDSFDDILNKSDDLLELLDTYLS